MSRGQAEPLDMQGGKRARARTVGTPRPRPHKATQTRGNLRDGPVLHPHDTGHAASKLDRHHPGWEELHSAAGVTIPTGLKLALKCKNQEKLTAFKVQGFSSSGGGREAVCWAAGIPTTRNPTADHPPTPHCPGSGFGCFHTFANRAGLLGSSHFVPGPQHAQIGDTV